MDNKSSLRAGPRGYVTRILSTIVGCGLAFLLSSCGKNNGTPKPAPKPEADVRREVDNGASMQLADAKYWRAQLAWDQEPRYDDETSEMTGVVFIRTLDGTIPAAITGMKFTADMPQHGHGTGNVLPQLIPLPDKFGTYRFSNLFFTMNGLWRIQVSGFVDGSYDVWTTVVDVK